MDAGGDLRGPGLARFGKTIKEKAAPTPMPPASAKTAIGEPEAKKILGQHFLKNAEAVHRSVQALGMTRGEVIIEIGPGTGALTLSLQAACASTQARLIAIEKDESLVSLLQSGGAISPQTTLATGDVLLELPRLAGELHKSGTAYKVIGNIPYYITGALLRCISELSYKPLRTVLMTQLEVAERLVAPAGESSLIGMATRLWAEPSFIMKLKPTDFSPPPAVHSGIVLLTLKPGAARPEDTARYYELLHTIFKQPRKTLLNNLTAQPADGTSAPLFAKEEAVLLIAKLGLPPQARPQDLTVDQYLAIAIAKGK